jgi:hypothetical protein
MKLFNSGRVKVKTMEENTNKHGFKIPNDYFASMDKHLVDRMEETYFPQHHGLSAPKNYFDTIEDRILTSVSHESTKSKVVPLFAKKWMPFVSGVAACFIAGLFIWNLLNVNSKLIADTEISAYIENGTLSVDTQDLAQLLTEEDMDELTLEAVFLSDENLESYLLEHLDESNLYQ